MQTQSWSSVGRAASDPFGTWADDLAQAFVRLEPEKVGERPFSGRIVKADAGALQISRVDATGHKVVRLPAHIGLSSPGINFVNLQVEGIGLTRQCGRDMQSQPFDIAVVDTTRPFEIVHRNGFSLFSIAVPRTSLPAGLQNGGALRLSADETGRQIAQMLLTYAAMALRIDVEEAAAAMFGRHALDLLDHALRRLSDQPAGLGEEKARLPIMKDFVQQNIANERLSAQMIARVFGLSERYVHKLFASSDTTLSEYVNQLRLDRAAGLLSLPMGKAPAITEIALRAGFSDLSYFNRRFKRRFGETPREFRQRWLKAASGETSSG